MTRLTTRILALWLAMAAGSVQAQIPDVDEEGPFVRVKKNQDGSRTIFRRSPDNRVLKKNTYSANHVLQLITVYRMDALGNPRSCKIYDGKEQELFKVRYGYDKRFGRLVEEQMFDSRVKRRDPNTGKEMPVRRFLYTYNAQGNRSKPISIVLKPGGRAETIYGAAPSALGKNPFDEPPRKGRR